MESVCLVGLIFSLSGYCSFSSHFRNIVINPIISYLEKEEADIQAASGDRGRKREEKRKKRICKLVTENNMKYWASRVYIYISHRMM